MPKARRGRVKDKWREKQWIVVEAPEAFGSQPVAYIPITDAEKAKGRVIETTLFDLTKQDPQHYMIKLHFQIIAIQEGRAKTIFKGHEYSREFLKSLIRRGSSMVDYIADFTTRDGFKVRIYVVAFTQKRINASRKHAIRMRAKEVIEKRLQELDYDRFAQEVVLGKIGSDILAAAKKVCNIRHAGVRKTKLVQPGRPLEELVALAAPTPSQPPSAQSEG